jgi:hypothetical protein
MFLDCVFRRWGCYGVAEGLMVNLQSGSAQRVGIDGLREDGQAVTGVQCELGHCVNSGIAGTVNKRPVDCVSVLGLPAQARRVKIGKLAVGFKL